MSVGSHLETVGFFESRGESLFGIHTRPPEAGRNLGVISLPQPGTVQSNALGVRLARRLAARGFDVLRFDLHGYGESTGTSRLELDRPFVDDVEAGVEWMRRRGVERFLLLGGCFCARTVLTAAARIQGVEGILCAAMPVSDSPTLQKQRARRVMTGSFKLSTLRSLATAEGRSMFWKFLRSEGRWLLSRLRGPKLLRRLLGRGRRRPGGRRGAGSLSSQVAEALERLVERRVPLLFVFGTEDLYYEQFQAATGGELGELIRTAEGRIQVEASYPGELHAYKTIAAQEYFLEAAERWAARFSAGAEAGRFEGVAGR